MAGTFTAQSKIRPGAYINFKSTASNAITVGDRGIVAIPMDLSWGDATNLVTITANDFVSGRTFEKLGINPTDAAAIPLREIFKNAGTALVGRLNANPVKATAVVTLTDSKELTLEALYGGTFGNNITVSCVKNATTSALELVTTISGLEVDRQIVTTLSTYSGNSWFKITYAGTDDPAFNEFAGVPLGTITTGANGDAIEDKHYSAFFEKCSTEIWNVMAIPTEKATLPPLVTTYIKDLREKNGKKVQAVVFNYSEANHEGIISVDQGYIIATESSVEEVVPANFIAYVAGATAGASIVDSNTYKVVTGATGIIHLKSASVIETGLQSGKLMLSMRQDRSIVIEKDINTLHNFTSEKGYEFSKNRIIRCLDDIATQITSVFEKSFIGKVNNDDYGRTLFKASVIGYLNNLQSQGAIQNFDSATDIAVSAGNDLESIVCDIAIQPVDSMEKLYMTVVMS